MRSGTSSKFLARVPHKIQKEAPSIRVGAGSRTYIYYATSIRALSPKLGKAPKLRALHISPGKQPRPIEPNYSRCPTMLEAFDYFKRRPARKLALGCQSPSRRTTPCSNTHLRAQSIAARQWCYCRDVVCPSTMAKLKMGCDVIIRLPEFKFLFQQVEWSLSITVTAGILAAGSLTASCLCSSASQWS